MYRATWENYEDVFKEHRGHLRHEETRLIGVEGILVYVEIDF